MSGETKVRVEPMLELLSAHFKVIACLEQEIDGLEAEVSCLNDELSGIRDHSENLEIEVERLRRALGEVTACEYYREDLTDESVA